MMELFIWDYCPFCIMVVDHMKKLGFSQDSDYKVVDARPGTPGQKLLMQIGGKSQVPFLKDNNTLMYESRDIIKYLSKKLSE